MIDTIGLKCQERIRRLEKNTIVSTERERQRQIKTPHFVSEYFNHKFKETRVMGIHKRSEETAIQYDFTADHHKMLIDRKLLDLNFSLTQNC